MPRTITQHRKARRLTSFQRGDLARQRLCVPNVDAVERDYDIALDKSRALSRATDHNSGDHSYFDVSQAQTRGKLGREVLDLNAQPAAVDTTSGLELIDDVLDRAGWHGEADPHAST